MPVNFSLIDLITSKKFTDKVNSIIRDVTDSKIGELKREMNDSLKEINKSLDTILNKKDESQEILTDENVRNIIHNELARTFFRLYIKRNAWKT